jgi:Zn-dependent protease
MLCLAGSIEVPAEIVGMAFTASVWIIPVLLAVTLHEAAHGWTAWKLGDDTAKALGRVSFNPLRHVDPFGTVLLPAILLMTSSPFLFGWAKPVPVNFMRLREPRRSMVIVAAAGPAMNFALAYLSALALHLVTFLPADMVPWVGQNLINLITLNVILAVFNMLPLPPLDGGRVAVGLLPPVLARPLARLERYGFVILIALMFVIPYVSRHFGRDFDPFAIIVVGPVNYLTGIIAIAAGIQ